MPSYKNEDVLLSLIKRITPGHENDFEREYIPAGRQANNTPGYFEIGVSRHRKILLRGGSLHDLIAAYGWYLKHVAGVHLSWSGDRAPRLSSLPLPKEKIVQSSPWRYRYAYNYCALSYTMPFYDWSSWEHELDLLALNGFTHVLVTAGLEKVWQEVLSELGYPEKNTRAFIANPAYAAWWHMGNLEGAGGPVTAGMIAREAALGARIVKRLRELEMVPVMQGFTGLVPHDLGDHFPDLHVFPQGKWLNEFQRPALLDPLSPAFKAWAVVWYRRLHQVYGGASLGYSGDLFHEGGCYEQVNLPEAARCIQRAMQAASPGSCWFVQSWRDNPLPELVRGLDKNHTLILELWKNLSEQQRESDTLRTYKGHPWAWCEVTNFGGSHDLYGGLAFLSELPSWLLHHADRDHVCGLGLLSEGLQTNPVQYDLFFDLFWENNNIDLQRWLDDYVVRRYGKPDREIRRAFELLAGSVYDVQQQQEGSTESILCAKPSLEATKASTWASGQVYYHPIQVVEAAACLLKARPGEAAPATYRYDVVDVVRQVMADLARPVLAEIKKAVGEKETASFRRYVAFFLELIDDTETLLASDPHWLLGAWLAAARAKGKTGAEKDLMETAARRLVTTWSGRADLLDEYSNRQWSGLMKDYYKPRWQMFFDMCGQAIRDDVPLAEAEKDYAREMERMDLAFEHKRNRYTAAPRGDTLAIARELFAKYAPEARRLWEKHQDLVSVL